MQGSRFKFYFLLFSQITQNSFFKVALVSMLFLFLNCSYAMNFLNNQEIDFGKQYDQNIAAKIENFTENNNLVSIKNIVKDQNININDIKKTISTDNKYKDLLIILALVNKNDNLAKYLLESCGYVEQNSGDLKIKGLIGNYISLMKKYYKSKNKAKFIRKYYKNKEVSNFLIRLCLSDAAKNINFEVFEDLYFDKKKENQKIDLEKILGVKKEEFSTNRYLVSQYVKKAAQLNCFYVDTKILDKKMFIEKMNFDKSKQKNNNIYNACKTKIICNI